MHCGLLPPQGTWKARSSSRAGDRGALHRAQHEEGRTHGWQHSGPLVTLRSLCLLPSGSLVGKGTSGCCNHLSGDRPVCISSVVHVSPALPQGYHCPCMAYCLLPFPRSPPGHTSKQTSPSLLKFSPIALMPVFQPKALAIHLPSTALAFLPPELQTRSKMCKQALEPHQALTHSARK